MFKNYLKITTRSLKKHKTYSILNIAGLMIGFTTFFLIIQYVSLELSYDTFNDNYQNIYRIQTNENSLIKRDSKKAISPSALGPAMKQEFREVLDYTRIFKMIRTVVSYKNEVFRDDKIFYADPYLLSMFSFPALMGKSETALEEPNSVVITESAAKKYFGDIDPIGKILNFENKYDLNAIQQKML